MDEFDKLEKRIEKEWTPFTFEELTDREIPETRFLIEKIMPTNAITFLSGNPGSGKSWILIEIALAVAEGRKFLNRFETTKGKVLIIDEERRAGETQRRLKKLEAPKTKDVFITCLEGVKIDNVVDRERIIKFCEDQGIQLVIFDSLRSVNSLDENNSKEAQEIMDCFKQFVVKGISVLATHHNRKEGFLISKDATQTLRGSSGLLAGISSLISIDKCDNQGKRLELIISHPKMNEGEQIQPFQVALQEDEQGKMRWEFIKEIEADYTKIEKAKEVILRVLDSEGEKYQAELIKGLESQGFAERTLRRGLDELEDKKEVNYGSIAGKGNRKYYSIPKVSVQWTSALDK